VHGDLGGEFGVADLVAVELRRQLVQLNGVPVPDKVGVVTE
jgi:hypothetical protein